MVESSERERAEKATQAYAALSIGLVCILVGLPLWWKTTEVYRVSLPYSDISQLSTKHLKFSARVTIVVLRDDIDESQLSKFGQKLKHSLQDSTNGKILSSNYIGNVRHASEEEKAVFQKSKSVEELDSQFEKLSRVHEHGQYSLVVLPETSKFTLHSKAVVGRQRTAYLAFQKDVNSLIPVIAHLLRNVYVNEASLRNIFQAAKGAQHVKPEKETMRVIRSHSSYQVTLTLLNPQPDLVNAQWDIKQALHHYLQPFLTVLSDYVHLPVKSQVLHYTAMLPHPQRDDKNNCYYWRPSDLPHIINPIEKHLVSHVSTNPSLNFIVYVPYRSQAPLKVYDHRGKPSSSNAFLSPQWGGIYVYNIPDISNHTELPVRVDLDMTEIMAVMTSQLRMLLGVHTQVSDQNVEILSPGKTAINQWELDQWMRARTIENIATSTLTLKSLSQLVEIVRNMVINDEIGKEVHQAVDSVQKSLQFLSKGKLRDAYMASKKALLASEKAFFDPSLLELLYFPEDQKFAIYIPLFLPVGLPIVISLVQAFKWMKNKPDKTKTE